ncbi:response regulator [Microcoleus sp. FACHB-53]|nr:response regulator [Microcoleus sp. FACHB-53]
MNLDELAPKIEHWFSRVTDLLQERDVVSDTPSLPPHELRQFLREACEELHIALEELSVAQSELLQQNQELILTREAVEVQRQRYVELFELAPDGYLVTDVNGKIQEANFAAASMLNIEPRFLVGKPLSVFIAQPERQRFYALLIQLAQVDRVQEWEVTLQPRQDKVMKAALTVTPVREPGGKVSALRWLLRDITERQRMEEQQRLLIREQAAREAAEAQAEQSAFLAEASRLLASCLDYSTTLNRMAQLAVPRLADWCFIDCAENNPALFNQPVVAATDAEQKARILQRRVNERLPFEADYGITRVLETGEPKLISDIPDAFLISIAQDAAHLELLRQFNAKSYMIVPLIARERTLGTMVFVSSKPERRYSRGDLMMAVELAQRCAIAMDNARLYQEALQANRIKDEFLSIVSHELRTPLNAILGWVTILRNRTVNVVTTARALETIERNAQSQKKLIGDILDISRIIRGKIRINTYPVHLDHIISAVIENVRPTADLKEIQIESMLDPSVPSVMGDAERLQQIVWNLLSNAIKFTPQGGRIEVRLEQGNSESWGCPYAQIVVRDTGKGIPPDFLPYVFEYFRQADGTTTRTHGGLGLGLAIVRQLVEMHNGVVYATSEGEGEGATFIVQLPMIHSEPKQPPQKYRIVLDNFPALDGLRVVVVDNCADTLELIAFILEQCKAQVRTATSVEEAINAIAQLKPDILISDIGMPEEDSYSLIRQVRTLEVDQGKPILAVALTAFAREEDRTRTLDAGFHMHLPKPVEPAELVAVVANLAERSQSIDV